MNNVVLIGRLTKDPETRYLGETAVTTFTLAVDRQQKERKADFIRIVAFGKTAELCERFLVKGRLVGIQGRIQTGSYKKEGVTHYTTDVCAERVEFLDWGDKKEKQEEQAGIPEGFQVLDDDEDIPF
jgi:single-strand DNA-binding protein